MPTEPGEDTRRWFAAAAWLGGSELTENVTIESEGGRISIKIYKELGETEDALRVAPEPERLALHGVTLQQLAALFVRQRLRAFAIEQDGAARRSRAATPRSSSSRTSTGFDARAGHAASSVSTSDAYTPQVFKGRQHALLEKSDLIRIEAEMLKNFPSR